LSLKTLTVFEGFCTDQST